MGHAFDLVSLLAVVVVILIIYKCSTRGRSKVDDRMKENVRMWKRAQEEWEELNKK